MINFERFLNHSFSLLNKAIALACLLLLPLHVLANDGPAPPSHITSLGIATKTASHFFNYSHFKIIGACFWWKMTWHGPSFYPTLELDEYLPDLVVTVYNGAGNDPWFEANGTIDKIGHTAGNAVVHALTGFPLTNGNNNTAPGGSSYSSIRTKSVDVIGNPLMFLNIPFLHLKSDTTGFLPYFQSDLDALARSGAPEASEPGTLNPFDHFIGSNFLNHWGYEFPRSMLVDVDNDYKASVMVAQHAADIVTNHNLLHVVHSTADSCGINCAVSNVIEEQNETHEIWQEVYPLDRHIHPGQSDAGQLTSLGKNDEAAGHGNYVFVVWRHYRGCVQGDNYLFSTTDIPPTQKR